MGKHAPLTTCFQDIQNRIDDAMFAMNTFGHAGGGTFKKKESFSNKEEHVKPVPDLIRGCKARVSNSRMDFPCFPVVEMGSDTKSLRSFSSSEAA